MGNVLSKPKFFESIGYNPHPRQVLYHESQARFRIPVCGRRFGKSLMAGRDLEPELFMPKKRFWAVGPCVDTDTEILTLRGWKRFDEVEVGDLTLSINPITGLSEWDAVEKVLHNPGVHEVLRMEGQSFSAVSTPDHRWLTKRREGIGYRTAGSKLPKALKPIAHLLPQTANGWTWRTTATLTADDRSPRAAICSEIPTEAKYTDEFVELVAWLWTEGSEDKRNGGRGFCIHQSHEVNPNNVERIRRALTALCPNPVLTHSRIVEKTDYWSECVSPSDLRKTNFYIGKELAKQFRAVLRSHKIVDPTFITSLTFSQLELFVKVSVLGDGTVEKHSGQTVIYQKNTEQLFAVQLACSLLGIPTSIRERGVGYEGFSLGLLTNSFVNPKRAMYHEREVGMAITKETYEGTTWCVTTKNGNWLAKRRGTIYYTGNTYDLAEKEFRVVWDDLIIGKLLGRDKRVKKAYNKRSGEMYIEFPWQTRFECRSASHPETLVGEALDGVILSEAAKHNPETWERFIRPSLADKRGWATMPTTPEGMNWLYLLWRLGQNPDYADYASWQFPSWENIAVYPGSEQDPEIELLRLTMSPEEFAQEIAALFTSFVGRIYHEFDERTHVSKQIFNPAWPNYIGFDFGYTNPLAAVEFQVDPWDGIHVWREHYMSYKAIDEHISMLQNRAQPPGYHLDLCFGDAADPEAVAVLNRDFAPCIALPEAKQNWKQGVEVVKRFLKSYPVGEADEFGTPLLMPKLQIDHSCIHTILEFNSYKKKKTVNSLSESNKVGAAMKQDDHSLDAIRYALVHIFELGATYHLADTLGSGDLASVGSNSGYFTTDLRF